MIESVFFHVPRWIYRLVTSVEVSDLYLNHVNSSNDSRNGLRVLWILGNKKSWVDSLRVSRMLDERPQFFNPFMFPNNRLFFSILLILSLWSILLQF